MILVGIIAAKSKPFVVHLNVLSYNNCSSIGRYLFVNPVRYIYIYKERTENNNFSVVGAMTVQLRKGMCLIRKYPYPSHDLAAVYYKA